MSDDRDRFRCPEHTCGLSFKKRDELITHLKWDHNRSQFRAENMVGDGR